MASDGKILRIDPPFGIAGGEITIDCVGFDTSDPALCAVIIGDSTAPIVALGPNRILAVVPETKGGQVQVRLQSGEQLSPPAYMTVARKLASDLHPRSEEHTSELQSLAYIVCRLLLEKKKLPLLVWLTPYLRNK